MLRMHNGPFPHCCHAANAYALLTYIQAVQAVDDYAIVDLRTGALRHLALHRKHDEGARDSGTPPTGDTMSLTTQKIRETLGQIALPDGGDLVSRDMVRALAIDGGAVRFVIEAASPDQARSLEPVRRAAEAAVKALAGVTSVSAVLTAHGPSAKAPPAAAAGGEPPSLKIGRHPTPQPGPARVTGVDRILAIASGKGGVGKSTVSSNLAVALARQGRRVGLLDADIYGPSQPRMMGVCQRPASPDGKIILPLHAHGVTMMSIGLMMEPGKAVVWRGPMLMGALQQMLGQVQWGELDVLIVDLPPGTGDVQLTLCQKAALTGAIVVSTPQDVALLDARKAIDMFNTLQTPVLGLIENMSTYICPNCGHEAHIFGHGGVRDEAERIGVPFLGALPLDLDTRLAGDAGTPIAAGEGAMAKAYGQLARGLIDGGIA
jgi:ATP-binding protein involved in chromosome partitioning